VEWDGLASGDYYCSYLYEWNKEVENAPLNKRGWVLQERLLAPRVLHFGAQQLYWECKEFAASETQPGGLSKEMTGTTLKEGWHLLRTKIGTDGVDRCYSAWEYSIAHYSNCGLSKSSDKLIALSGLARRLHNCLEEKDTYLAGLWRSQLPRTLLWRNSRAKKLENLSTRLTDYRAPSWPWASLSTGVVFPNFVHLKYGDPIYEEATPLVEVLEAMTTPAGNPEHCSPFGLIAGGMIRLRGRLFRVSINLESRDRVNPLRIYVGEHGHVNHLGFPCMHYSMRTESLTYQTWMVSLDEKITQTETPTLNVYCMLFFHHHVAVNPDCPVERVIEGLLFEPSMGRIINGSKRAVKGEFTRFGYIHGTTQGYHPSVENKLIMSDLAIEAGKTAEDLEQKCGKANEDGTFTITII
jgi:hypothetical protein